MKTIFLKLTVFGIIFLFLTGCFFNKTPLSTSDTTPAEEPSEHPAFSRQSESSYYYFTEAEIQKNKGNLERAIHLLEKAIENDPGSSFLKRELALISLQQKKNVKALKTVQGIIDSDPNNVKVLILYGKLKQELKEIPDAERTYEQVIFLDPKQKNIYLILGRL